MESTIQLLWTGGWDSTFRVLQILKETEFVIQPHYIIDPARSSSGIEIKTMEKIRRRLQTQIPNVKDRLLPLLTTNLENIPADPEITAALYRLREERHVGKQYDWLARYARHVAQAKLELNIESTDKATELARESLTEKDDVLSRYTVPPGNENINVLFKDFFFPLADLDKPSMKRRVTGWNMSSIMEETWFCYFPLPGGYACGTCRPCVYVMDKGQKWRMSLPGRIRYQLIERTRRQVPFPVKNWLRQRVGQRVRRWLRSS